MKLSEIYEGWRNKILPPEKLKDKIAEVSAERIAICAPMERCLPAPMCISFIDDK